MFLSNIYSLTDSAYNSLFNDCKKTHIISILETRATIQNKSAVVNKFLYAGRKCFFNEAEPSKLGGMAHGGEILTPHKHLNTKKIDPKVWDFYPCLCRFTCSC